jgi:hypothetical protein
LLFWLIPPQLHPLSLSVCNSETIGDYPAWDTKTAVVMVHVAFAETVGLLHKLQREMYWRGQWGPITKLICRWFWMWCGNFTISCLCPNFKKCFSKATSLV